MGRKMGRRRAGGGRDRRGMGVEECFMCRIVTIKHVHISPKNYP